MVTTSFSPAGCGVLVLDHLTVIAPTLAQGVSHVRECLDLDVPFGTRHDYMGTHNHRVSLGPSLYLEIIAIDPEGQAPSRSRWFGLDNQNQVKRDWADGRRLRGWVASTEDIESVISSHGVIFGETVPLPSADPSFAFSIPVDGSLPLEGVAPSVIDHQGDTSHFEDIPDLGAQLRSFIVEHPDPSAVAVLYDDLAVANPPMIAAGPRFRYRALVDTPRGLKELT